MIELCLGLFGGFVFSSLGFGWVLHRREAAEPVEVVRLVETDRVEVWRDGRQVYAGPDRRRRGVEDAEAYRWPDGRRDGDGGELDEVVDPVEEVLRFESKAQREAARLIALEADPWGQHK